MATFTDPAKFARHIRDGATIVERSRRMALQAAALSAKTIMLAAPGAPRGKVARGRVGVRFDIKGFSKPTALVRWTGPAHLVNNPTAAHYIVNKGKKKALASANFGPVAYAEHPGTRGKHFYEKGRDVCYREVPKILRRQYEIALSRHFGR